jgi:cell division protein FtsL
MDLDFQYTFRRTVANRPIVHEFDKVRQRDLWQLVGSFLVIAAILLVWVWERHQIQHYGVEMARLQQQEDTQETERRETRSQIEQLRSPTRIAKLAIGQMHLVPPGPDDAVIIQLAVSAPAPPASVVAAVR